MVEHLEISMGVCLTAFALQVHPSACKVFFSPGLCITRLRHLCVRQAEDFFTFAAVGGVSRCLFSVVYGNPS